MTEQIQFQEALEQLKGAYERDVILYKVMVSTLEGGAGQQERIMKEKDKRIEKLEAQVKELQGRDFENIIDKIYGEHNLESPTGRGMVKYPFNPEGSPEPYPYTNPIREVPAYGRVK